MDSNELLKRIAKARENPYQNLQNSHSRENKQDEDFSSPSRQG